MPMYEFECLDCGALTEVPRKVERRNFPCRCRECGSGNTTRYYSPVKHVYACPVPGFTNAEIASNTERAKKEHGVWKG